MISSPPPSSLETETNPHIETETNPHIETTSTEVNNIVNRGTGAGGARTNLFGKLFESTTDNTPRLLSKFNYRPMLNDYGLKKYFHDKDLTTVVFSTQHKFKRYMKSTFGIVLFRCPDEAYIVETASSMSSPVKIAILEKKAQNKEGSVETKLWAAPSLKREYELILGPRFQVSYALCVNDYLKKLLTSPTSVKYKTLNTILAEHNIQVLFGDDPDYFDTLDAWITDHHRHCSL